MLRRKFLKFLIIAIFIITPWYYAKNHGYIEKLKHFIASELGDFAEIKGIEISGNKLLSEDDVLEVIDLKKGDKIYELSAKKMREQLLVKEEVKNIDVSINYSGLIKIGIEEKKPFAIWWLDNTSWLIDENGDKILQISDKEKYTNLMIVFGQNIKGKLKIFLDIVKLSPLYKEITTMHYIGNRRWDVYLNDTIIIKLPEQDVGLALENAGIFLKNPKYQDRIDIVDLRLYPKRVFLTLKEKI